jgi:hypothetical protein
MGKEAERDKAIMTQIIKLHKKIDYLTDEVMGRLDKIMDEEAQKEFPFAPKQGIQSITMKTREENE